MSLINSLYKKLSSDVVSVEEILRLNEFTNEDILAILSRFARDGLLDMGRRFLRALPPEVRRVVAREEEPSEGPHPDKLLINEELLFVQSLVLPANRGREALIKDLSSLERLQEIGSGRFGSVHLFRRAKTNGEFEYFAGKSYNAGRNRERIPMFREQFQPFLELSHPHVMPIVGVIDPTKANGPIILTPYSEFGSLEDFLNRVRRNDPPSNWNNATKLRMIISLVSGLHYLHDRGIVHRELKPSDLIVQPDGSLRICGHFTSFLEHHRYTRASAVGSPTYKAPEMYDDDDEGSVVRDPKSDVFAFALIIYELLVSQKVFPATLSTASIMRRSLSTKSAARPIIPSAIHRVLQDIITTSWRAETGKRLSFDAIWARMRTMGFRLFPDVDVKFIPAFGPS